MTRLAKFGAAALLFTAAPAFAFQNAQTGAGQAPGNRTTAPADRPGVGTSAAQNPRAAGNQNAQAVGGQNAGATAAQNPRAAGTQNLEAGRGQAGQQGQAGIQGQAGQQGRFDDTLFAAVASDSGLAEVAASRMAVERASSDEVKEYARQMIEDHTRANQQLMSAARNVQVPNQRKLSPAKRAELAILGSKSGEEFDRAYADQQVAAHICAVALFKAESQMGQNQEMKQFASETLPKLQHHLQMARSLPGAMSGSDQGQHQGQNKGQGQDQNRDRD